MTIADRGRAWCPWGCGQQLATHRSDRVCPPQNSAGRWLNSPNKILGATEQLADDVRILQDMQEKAECKDCSVVLERRLSVIQSELHRRGYRSAR